MKSKFPDKLRVTLKQQSVYLMDDNGDYIRDTKPDGTLGPVRLDENAIPLGFANVYEPNTKAYAKREDTQNRWAYANYYEKNGLMCSKSHEWIVNPNRGPNQPGHIQIFHDIEVKPKFQPIIIDNIAIEGFRIQKSVSRYSTSNKVWRIFDPRGFELEISSDNMEDIIHGGFIDRGLIVGKCRWRTSKILERVV